MWYQFFLQNWHFAINLFAALAFFSVFWLYLDAWVERKAWKEGWKIIGLLFLSLAFLAHATYVESTSFSVTVFAGGINEKIAVLFKNLGYLFLAFGLIIDPLQPKPDLKKSKLPVVWLGFSGKVILMLFLPISAAVVAWLYLRRATIGLEDHLKKVALAFYFFAVYELLSTAALFVGSVNVDIFRLVAPFGSVWVVANIVEMLGTGILLGWAFSYLLKRINTQLFIIFTTAVLSIFLLTTVSFTYLLLNNLSTETSMRLKTDVSVLSFAFDSKKSEVLASASILSKNAKVAEALTAKDKKTLSTMAEELIVSVKATSVVLIGKDGQVLARGEDRDRVGDSMSSDSLVKRVMKGEEATSFLVRESAVAPSVIIRGVSPVKLGETVVGAVLVEEILDNVFLDGIKSSTGLEMGIYGGQILAATTITDLKGTTRPIGIKESDMTVVNLVLTKGKDYSGLVSLLNTSYFAAYHPLKDIDGSVVGMLMAGRPSVSIYAAASQSVELTFLVTVALMLLTVIPSYLVSRYITNQLK